MNLHSTIGSTHRKQNTWLRLYVSAVEKMTVAKTLFLNPSLPIPLLRVCAQDLYLLLSHPQAKLRGSVVNNKCRPCHVEGHVTNQGRSASDVMGRSRPWLLLPPWCSGVMPTNHFITMKLGWCPHHYSPQNTQRQIHWYYLAKWNSEPSHKQGHKRGMKTWKQRLTWCCTITTIVTCLLSTFGCWYHAL